MTIGLDVRILQESGAARGIATYIRGLLDGFERAGLADRVARFRYPSPLPSGAVPPERTAAALVRRRWREERFLADASNQVALPFEVKRAGVSLFHAPSPYDLAWWYPVPLVVTIHDMAPLSHAAGIVRTGLEHRFLYRFARRAARVIAVSEFARGEILRHLAFAPERVVVVPEAAQPGLAAPPPAHVAQVAAALGIAGPYFLHVGGYDRVEPRKDVSTLLGAFVEVRRRGVDATLVLAGGGGAGIPPLVEQLERHGVADHVLLTGYVPTEDLAALYAGAAAFVFPSTYEGFGLPVLEAMTCGAPCLIARAGSLPEVAGEAALACEPGDVSGFATAMAELASRAELRAELRTRGTRRAGEFDWERTARLTWEVYEAALGR